MNLKKRVVLPVWLYVVVLLFISCVLVFYNFLSVPHNLAYDEVASTQLALYLGNHPFTIYSPLATGHATPYYYIIMLSFRLFGVNTFALRLPAALFGIANVVIFYAIVLQIYKRKSLAFIYAFLFITMRWYLTFSRFSFEATFLIFLELLSIFFLLKDADKTNYRLTITSAVFAALSFYSYLPGRIFFLVPLAYMFITQRKKWKIYAITIVLIITPLLIYFIRHPDVRINQVSVIAQKNVSVPQKASVIGQNVIRSVEMLFTKGDMNGRHNFPGKSALNIIMMVFFVSGLIYIMYKKHNRYTGLFLSYIVVSIIPTLFTPLADNPSMLRTITAIPGVVYIMGGGVFALTHIKLGKSYKPAVCIVALLIALSVAYELRTYFVFQSRVFRNAFEVNCPLEELSKWSYTYVPLHCRVKHNEF